MNQIKVALVGIGNCASSLVQGVHYYADGRNGTRGLIHEEIGGYGPGDVEVVLAIDTDARKVGRDLSEAIFAPPNCTAVFQSDIPVAGVEVTIGPSAFFCKHPPKQFSDDVAAQLTDEFIAGDALAAE